MEHRRSFSADKRDWPRECELFFITFTRFLLHQAACRVGCLLHNIIVGFARSSNLEGIDYWGYKLKTWWALSSRDSMFRRISVISSPSSLTTSKDQKAVWGHYVLTSGRLCVCDPPCIYNGEGRRFVPTRIGGSNLRHTPRQFREIYNVTIATETFPWILRPWNWMWYWVTHKLVQTCRWGSRGVSA
jgi:hypothetical protein